MAAEEAARSLGVTGRCDTRLHERGTMAGRMISGAAALAELVRAAGEHDAPGVHRVLPVAPELSGLLPGRGLRRPPRPRRRVDLPAAGTARRSLALGLVVRDRRPAVPERPGRRGERHRP